MNPARILGYFFCCYIKDIVHNTITYICSGRVKNKAWDSVFSYIFSNRFHRKRCKIRAFPIFLKRYIHRLLSIIIWDSCFRKIDSHSFYCNARTSSCLSYIDYNIWIVFGRSFTASYAELTISPPNGSKPVINTFISVLHPKKHMFHVEFIIYFTLCTLYFIFAYT